MEQTKFSLSWASHRLNLSSGLSSLQQSGEFVDMTLAADGHHVKVHQVILALASPFIKELISSAHCSHPIIFLNKISYNTLSAILEYVYTGEVQVAVENLNELFEAGRELHIKGLEDVKKITRNITPSMEPAEESEIREPEEQMEEQDSEFCYFEIGDDTIKYQSVYGGEAIAQNIVNQSEDQMEQMISEQTFDESLQSHVPQKVKYEPKAVEHTEESNSELNSSAKMVIMSSKVKAMGVKKAAATDVNVMQYTVSNQGNLQLILNRFVYYLKHTKRDGTRHWRCVDYLGPGRCPATLVTNDDAVIKRINVHTHMFHDKKILKKVNDRAIFSAIQDAIKEGETKKSHLEDKKHAPSHNNSGCDQGLEILSQ